MLARLRIAPCFSCLLLVVAVMAGARPLAAQRLSPLEARVVRIAEPRYAPTVTRTPTSPLRAGPTLPVLLPNQRRTRVSTSLLARDFGPIEALILLDRNGPVLSGCLRFRLRPF